MTVSESTLARKTIVEVSVDGTTEWTAIRGKTKFMPKIESQTEDGATMEDDGWEYPEVAGQKWELELEVLRKRYSPDTVDNLAYDAGQELCRSTQGQFGPATEIYVRWYDTDGLLDGKTGLALVQWEDGESAVKGLASAKIKFGGKGPVTDFDNPNTPEEE